MVRAVPSFADLPFQLSQVGVENEAAEAERVAGCGLLGRRGHDGGAARSPVPVTSWPPP